MPLFSKATGGVQLCDGCSVWLFVHITAPPHTRLVEAGALHRAKAAVSKNGEHPSYWANFILFARSLEAAQ